MITITADKVKVWKNVKEDGSHNFTYSISSKDIDGNYSYMTKRIKFLKDSEPQDTCEIKINNAFQSFFEINGTKYDYLMVLNYDIITGPDKSVTSDEVVLNDDDLPF